MKGIHQHSMLISLAMCWINSEYIRLCLEMAVTGFVSFGALGTKQWGGIINTAGCSAS